MLCTQTQSMQIPGDGPMIIDMLKKVNGSKILPQDTKIIWDLLRIHSFRINNREPYQTIGPMTTQEISTGALLVTHSMPTQTPGLSHHQKDTTIMFAFNLPLKSTWASLSTQVWSQKVSDLTRLNRPPKYPIIGAYFKTLNIPVHRGNRMKAARSIVQASREVKKGWSIVIFPEGQIPDVNPKMKHFKSGAFQLAKNLNLPIVPMTFTNNHILFSDPTFILGPARPGICKVYMHDYISAEKVAGMGQKELRAYCYELLNGPLLEQYPELRKK